VLATLSPAVAESMFVLDRLHGMHLQRGRAASVCISEGCPSAGSASSGILVGTLSAHSVHTYLSTSLESY
jgi:hypothetical protein